MRMTEFQVVIRAALIALLVSGCTLAVPSPMGELSSAERTLVGCYEVTRPPDVTPGPDGRTLDSLRLDAAYADPPRLGPGPSPGRRMVVPPFDSLAHLREGPLRWWLLAADTLIIGRSDGFVAGIMRGRATTTGFHGRVTVVDDYDDGTPDLTWEVIGRRIQCPLGGEAA